MPFLFNLVYSLNRALLMVQLNSICVPISSDTKGEVTSSSYFLDDRDFKTISNTMLEQAIYISPLPLPHSPPKTPFFNSFCLSTRC